MEKTLQCDDMKKKHSKRNRHLKKTKHYKGYLRLAFKVVIITLLLLSGYYFLFLKPKLAIPNALRDSEKALSVHYFTLIENRIAYTELTKLDATSSSFEFEKDEILSKIQKSNEDGLKELEDPAKVNKIFGFPNGNLNFLNNEVPSAYSKLLEKNKKAYEDQKKISEKLIYYDSAVSKLFAYNPQTDLGGLDLRKDKEEMLERVAKARNGLKSLQESLGNDNNDRLSKQINDVLTLLNALENSLQVDNHTSSTKLRNDLYNQFSEVKKEAFSSLLSIIRSNDSVKLLQDQTNLILEYEFWLKKINQFQIN